MAAVRTQPPSASATAIAAMIEAFFIVVRPWASGGAPRPLAYLGRLFQHQAVAHDETTWRARRGSGNFQDVRVPLAPKRIAERSPRRAQAIDRHAARSDPRIRDAG